MVLGLRSKNRKGNSVQIDYFIHVQEIKPWPISIKNPESLLLQWENGDQSSGSFTSNVKSEKIEFSESFRLPVTLFREASRKGTAREIFQKNYLEFSLYEPRKDRSTKGQLLGSAIINLADYGIIKDNVSISTPINLKKSSKSAAQPVLCVNIQPFDRDNLSKDGSESVSEVTNEGNDEESEIASFTDDDIDDNVSSSSSRTVSSFAMRSGRGSPGQDEKNLLGSANSDIRRAIADLVLPSSLPSLDPKINATVEPSSMALSSVLQKPVNDHNVNFWASDDYNQVTKNSNHAYLEVSQTDKDKLKNKHQEKGQNGELEQVIGELPQEAEGRQVKLRSNTLAVNRISNGAQGNTRRDKLKHLKSVQLQNDVSESYEPVTNIQPRKKTPKPNITENVHKDRSNHAPKQRQRTTNEADFWGETHTVCESCVQCKTKFTQSNFSGELESKVEMLEEELMETAAVEVGIYSIVAEHGSSTSKVHAPARRLSRFYLHACKHWSQAKRASAAKTIVSGLVLVSKACGNDVPRLTFWLSNSIVLRAIVSQVDESSINENSKTSSEEWDEPGTFIVALERIELWIFTRIVESVWWQTVTPHMQSTAVKGSCSKKSHAKRYGLSDQEQGNFAIDLWKKAFRDACERLCPIRAGGHECGCLPLLSRLVMEQLVHRLDVAMFNAILRESAEEMPTDPVSDPISDPKVLPIPAGKASFGAGAQLKNAVGNWSLWLTDLFGVDDNNSPEDKNGVDNNSPECETSFKAFHYLRALSDLMMLPFDMLADRSIRKEVCPEFGTQIIERVLDSFVPDEFNPDPITDAMYESLDSEGISEDGKECITSLPCTAGPIIYTPSSTASLLNIIGEVENQSLRRIGSAVLRKSYTSDDELDKLNSPLSSIIVDNSRAASTSMPSNWMPNGNGGRKVRRYELLRGVWMDS